QVCQVVKKELGGAPEEIFDEFDPVPIASASLAQVHVARTHEGQKVAVKVQHMHMTDTAAADYATVEFVVNTLHWLFPSFDYRWLVDEVHDSLPKELDFLNEAKNSIKCMDNFRKLSPHIADYVYAPKMYASLYFPQITELLHKLPRVILLMLKTNDCLRSVNNALIKRPSVESFIIIGRVSSEALIAEKLSHANSLFSLLHVWLEDISLEARFLIMQVALWILQFRTASAL
nr:putative ABC1 protein At2g40090 [Tanacetum cinerariifolium]